MIEIQKEKCVGCGACVKDCFPRNLSLVDGKAVTLREVCMLCGHCIAVCPHNAVKETEYPMEDVKVYDKMEPVDADMLLDLIKARRSVRQFTGQAVEKEKIEKIIEAGRFTPTASNRQSVSYIVLQDKLAEVLQMALGRLNGLGEAILANKENHPPIVHTYAAMWKGMYEQYQQAPHEPTPLFFKSNTVILVVSDTPVDAHLAASNMELMVHAQKLGMFFSGFFVRAAQGNEELKRFLGIDGANEVQACMVMGYPDVRYYRNAPRKKAPVQWL